MVFSKTSLKVIKDSTTPKLRIIKFFKRKSLKVIKDSTTPKQGYAKNI